jgi:hypothetical protein
MAGHTLDLEMDKLKRIPRDRYTLVAIDQTHQRLIKGGLIPDYCFTLDLCDFADKGFWVETENTVLVAPTTGNMKNVLAWKGEVSLYKMTASTGSDIDKMFNGMQEGDFEDIGHQFCMATVGLSVLQMCVQAELPSWWIGLDFGYLDKDKKHRFCQGYGDKLETNARTQRPDYEFTFDNGKKFYAPATYMEFARYFMVYASDKKYKLNYASPGGWLECVVDPRYTPYINIIGIEKLGEK